MLSAKLAFAIQVALLTGFLIWVIITENGHTTGLVMAGVGITANFSWALHRATE